MKSFFKKLMRKGFSIELEGQARDKQSFLDAIENYCIKEGLSYEFIERDRPAIISIDGVVYSCELKNAGRPGLVINFVEKQ
ncbi:MAG: DUF4318 domain-containing protein [Bacillaceae bacterium]